MGQKTILVVDDDSSIRALVRFCLEKEGFSVIEASDGAEAKEAIETANPSLILLDIMLPDINGIDLCLDIRRKSTTPVLFLSCKEEEMDKIIAFSVGGDDYITKPFLPGEFIARIKANLRRSEFSESSRDDEDEDIYEVPGMIINNSTREVFLDGNPVVLTTKEFDILLLFIKNPRRIYSAEQLFEHAWKEESLKTDKNTIMVYISNLRKKIDTNERKYILSIRNLGYKFNHHLMDEESV